MQNIARDSMSFVRLSSRKSVLKQTFMQGSIIEGDLYAVVNLDVIWGASARACELGRSIGPQSCARRMEGKSSQDINRLPVSLKSWNPTRKANHAQFAACVEMGLPLLDRFFCFAAPVDSRTTSSGSTTISAWKFSKPRRRFKTD